MAQCPNCGAQLSITSADCKKCGAVFVDGGGWQPIPQSSEEEKHALERRGGIASTGEPVSRPTERVTSKALWLLHALAAMFGAALMKAGPAAALAEWSDGGHRAASTAATVSGLTTMLLMGVGFGASWAFASWVNGLPISKATKVTSFWIASVGYFLAYLMLFFIFKSIFGRTS